MSGMKMRPGLAADLSRALGEEGWDRENSWVLRWHRSAQDDGFVLREELRIWRQRDASVSGSVPAALATIQQWLAVYIDVMPNSSPASRLVGQETLRMTVATTAAAVAQPILTTLAARRERHLATARWVVSRALPRLGAMGDPPGYRSDPSVALSPWVRYWRGTDRRTGRERILGAFLMPWVQFDHPDRPTLLLSPSRPGEYVPPEERASPAYHNLYIPVGDALNGFVAAEARLAAWATGQE